MRVGGGGGGAACGGELGCAARARPPTALALAPHRALIPPPRPSLCSRETDRHLPTANIGRIMKKALPSTAKIGKDAKETVQECVSEFISFITSE